MKQVLLILFLMIQLISCRRSEKSLLKDAETAYNSKDYQLALLRFSNLIDINKLNGEYYYKRAYCYAILHDPDRSIDDYKKAIELNYKVAECYYNLGLFYRYIDDDLALHYFERAIDSNFMGEDPKIEIDMINKRRDSVIKSQ